MTSYAVVIERADDGGFEPSCAHICPGQRPFKILEKAPGLLIG